MYNDRTEKIYIEMLQYFKDPTERYATRVRFLIAEHYPRASKLDRNTFGVTIKGIRRDFTKEDWNVVKYMFKSIFVFIMLDHRPQLLMESIDLLLDVYPEFEDTDSNEKNLLLRFRNLFKVACEIVDPKNHKCEMISLIGRMCGVVYVTGGGQSSATDRRILMYERETGIASRKNTTRCRRRDDPATISLARLHAGQGHKLVHNHAVSQAQRHASRGGQGEGNSMDEDEFEDEGEPKYRIGAGAGAGPNQDWEDKPTVRSVRDTEQTLQLLRSHDAFFKHHRALFEAKVAAFRQGVTFNPQILHYSPTNTYVGMGSTVMSSANPYYGDNYSYNPGVHMYHGAAMPNVTLRNSGSSSSNSGSNSASTSSGSVGHAILAQDASSTQQSLPLPPPPLDNTEHLPPSVPVP